MEEINIDKPKKRWHALKPSHIIVLGFLGLITIGSILLNMPFCSKSGEFFGLLNSFFTATSAVCVTGLIVVDTATHFTVAGQIIILLLIQFGGLGFMTLTTMIMMILRRKITLRDRLVIQEALNQNQNKGVVKLTRNIVFLTLIIEAIGALMLLPALVMSNGAIGIWQAVFTAISAFCNAGFDIMGVTNGAFSNFTGYTTNVLISLSISMLIVLGGLGFAVIMDVFKNKFRFKKLALHSKVVLIVSGILIFVGTLFFFTAEYSNDGTIGQLNFGQKILASLFHSVSTRTAGFNTVDLAALNPSSKMISMLLMFIGASPASTGGGIKTTTLAILILMVVAGISGKDNVIINKHTLKTKNLLKAVSVVLLSLMLVVIAAVTLLVTEIGFVPSDLLTLDNILFECFSAFGTVGLTLGVTPFLSPVGQIIVMLLMFFGRVGPVTIGLMFIKSNQQELIKYPDCNIVVG